MLSIKRFKLEFGTITKIHKNNKVKKTVRKCKQDGTHNPVWLDIRISIFANF